MFETNSVIRIEQVCKTFPADRRRFTVFGVLKSQLRKNGSRELFYALRDINFQMTRGEKLGVIGDNGAGKTTLLRLIAGLYQPDGGNLSVHGDVSLLAGLGIGMIDELTVEENIFLYGMIYGMDSKYIRERVPDILEWAELKNFVGSKLQHLSSGMKARLAFSTVRYIEKDIYLFDEALAAGDKHFKEKCEIVFQKYKESDKTILVATHDLKFVNAFCTRALWLHKGKQVLFGDVESVVLQYEESKPS
jgi:ABC-type polysaccharide/polyol phosphate transport system ATPase subunit